MSGSHSDFIVGNGEGLAADHASQIADPLSHVLFLREVRETTQIHAHRSSRISGKDWRSIRREAPNGGERAAEASVAAISPQGW